MSFTKSMLPTPVLMFICFSLFGQPDNQWLVRNGLGKQGVRPDNISQNQYLNILDDTSITLEGIPHPRRDLGANKKNNLFIIYSDNTYFNSREPFADRKYATDFFFPKEGTDQKIEQTKHNFILPSGKQIKYMYLTNIYEGDEPPNTISVTNGINGQNPKGYYLSPNIPASANEPILNAIHEVVPKTDIVLIISNVKLRAAGVHGIYEFSYGKIRRIGSQATMTHPDNFFEQSSFSVDGTSGNCILPFNSYSDISLNALSGKIVLNSDSSDYVYINLRPSHNIPDSLFPTGTGTPTYEALFTIIAHGFSQTHTEKLVRAHDPNYCELTKICKNDEEIYLHYHVQFENTTCYPTTNLGVAILFDDRYLMNSLEIEEWRAGDDYSGSRTDNVRSGFNNILDPITGSNNYKAYFRFPPNTYIQTDMAQPDMASRRSIGSIDFRIKVSNSADWTHFTTNVRPAACTVYFEEVPYPIKKFKDILRFTPDLSKPTKKNKKVLTIINSYGTANSGQTLSQNNQFENLLSGVRMVYARPIDVICSNY